MRPLYKIVMLLACVVCCASTSAQIRTVTFTGRDRTNQYHIPLSRVNVFNLDQLWEEVLYYPDTVLILGTVGVEDYDFRQNVQLMQNVPNPFDGTTEFALQLPDGGDVFLEIYDITGKLAVAERFTALPVGTHLFQATLSSPQTYLLSAKVDNGKMTIKMVNEGHGAGNTIHHLGMTDKNGDFTLYLKNEKASSSYPFHVGDEMQYEGFALLDGTQWESAVVAQPQMHNDTVPLLFDVTVPTVLTSPVADITANTVVCGGNVTADGNSPVTARGVCWSTSHNPTVDSSHISAATSGLGSFTIALSGLADGTTYYVRAYATNSVGTAYGEQKSFTTQILPSVITDSVSNITTTSAECGGKVVSQGSSAVIYRGVCWSISQNPTVDDSHTTENGGVGSFSSSITGLNAGVRYYVRAYATSNAGTAYGEQVTFVTTFTCGSNTVIDHDGNSYNTVQIGNQCWMKENLRTTHYADGTSISLGSSSTSTPHYYYPNNDSSTMFTYGLLYNWYAVMHGASSSDSIPSGIQGICPNGWHVPSHAEWTQLTTYVGSQGQYWCSGDNISIAKAMAAKSGWTSSSYYCAVGNNPSANNATGFSALPAGSWIEEYYVLNDPEHYSYQFGEGASFWSSTIYKACYIYYSHDFVALDGGYGLFKPLSVRCLRDMEATIPTVTTNAVSNIMGSSALCGGNVTDAGGAVVTARGVCWDTLPNPTVDDSFTVDSIGVGSFTSYLSGLADGTTYYVRAYATNGVGTAYGEQRTFTTLSLPLVTTDTVSNITGSTAVCGGNVISEGDAPVTARGVCWSTSINPTVDGQHTTIYGSGTGSFNSNLSGLTAGTTYYVRAYATSSLGTAYGEQRTFTTAFTCGNVVADYDGNSYNTVQIGNQCWMKENLRTAHLNNGVSIPLVQDSTSWGYSPSPAYCYYNQSTYGCLYNFYAVEGGQLCPPGWHVPTYNEVHTILHLTLGGSDAGGEMKTTGTTYWLSPNTGATNSSGFSARGGGIRYPGHSISGIKERAVYWTSNTYNDDYAYDFYLCYDQSYLSLYGVSAYDYSIWKRGGLSVRCLRDDEINEVSNPCPGLPTVTDYDGNVYHTVQIGGQCWMKENLRTTRYSDGTEITLAASNTDSSSTVAYRYNPGNHSFNVSTYGYLYNWPAVMNGEASSSSLPSNVQGICPMGWHVPSDAEWTQLTNYVSGQSEYVCNNYSGYIAKALASNTGWAYYTDTCAVGFDLSSNNATGFSALPSGSYDGNQCYYASGSFASFWSATETNSSYAYYRTLTYAIPDVLHYDDNKSDAYSVRCLRDGGGNPPNAPTGVAATLSGSQIQVSWNSVSNATSYKVYRSSSANGSYTLIGSPTNPYYYDANPLTGYNYYKVKAVNSAGESAFSSVASCNYVTAPTAPTGVSATLSGSQIQVSWSSVSNATSYKVYRSSSANGSYTLIGSPTNTYYYDANPLTGYNYYKVKAVNSAGESAYSSVASCNYAAVSHTISITLITDRYGSDITWQVKDVSTNTILASGGPYSDLSSNETTIQDIPTIYVDGTGCYVFIINDSYGDGLCCSSGNGSYSVSYDGVVIGSGGDAFWQETYYLNCPNVDDKSCPAAPTVTDHEGNVYATVQIGNQCWMRDNLRTTTSPSTGTYLIPSASTGSTYTGKQARWYNNDSTTYAPMNYGLLYNWNAAVDTFNTAYGETSVNTSSNNAVSVTFSGHRRGICPAGWHLPSDAEWTQLTDYVSSQSEYTCSGNSSYIAKALASTEGWNTSTNSCAVGNNQGSNNATGFSAVPAGICGGSSFNGVGGYAYFWSSTQILSDYAWYRSLGYGYANVGRYRDAKNGGFSVRCLRDETGTFVIDEKSCPEAPTVTDHEGNVYATVQIGNQCWMRDNLRTTTSPSTGTYLIPASGTGYTFTGKQARWYNNDSATYAPQNYGLLYNWNAAVDTFNTAYGETSVNSSESNAMWVTFNGHRRGICPAGWHLPSDAEWNTMEATVSGSDWLTSYETTTGWRGNHAGKLAGGDNWTSSTTSGASGDYGNADRNVSGFSAVPAGHCLGSSFSDAGYRANFWSSTQDVSSVAWYRDLRYNNADVGRHPSSKYFGFSVRCLRDTLVAEIGGGIPIDTTNSPSDTTTTLNGMPCFGTPTITDIDGNTYNTVQIGGQCWMRENLRTTRYADGTVVLLGADTSSTTAYRYNPSFDADNVSTYGYHYNWKAVMRNSFSSNANPSGVQGICPDGWHVPSRTEWVELTTYLSGNVAYYCEDSSNIAKFLSSTLHWVNSTNTCAVGNNRNLNNTTGFGALPAGCYVGNNPAGLGPGLGFASNILCTTESYNDYVWWCYIYYGNANVSLPPNGEKSHGYSVRCLRD